MPVKNYSSGMYVRLGFSVAINVDPDILLVDEVLAVGDEEFQRKCLERVADLREAGKTIVVVTHALGTVRNLCDEAIWLENGVMRAIGPGGDIADAYLGQVHVDREEDESGHGTRWGSATSVSSASTCTAPTGSPPSRSGPATRSPSGSTTRRPGRSSGPSSGSACSPWRACR